MPVSLDKEMEVLPAFLEKFPAWKNFPTGLHILFLDEDELALQHSRAQLEACRYTVTAFSDKRCAMDALEQRRESFHLAIVEVNLKNSAEAFNVVRAAKHLPTILLSAAKNVTLMMEGIAAGALEFLEKPLSEDKAKNLWQHVFRKALATGELIVPKQEKGEADMVKEPCDKSIEEDHHIKEEQTDSGSVLDDSLPIVGDSCDQLFIDDYMYGGNHDADGKEFDCLPDEKPGTSNSLADDFVAKSPGPSTPQLEQAEMRALNTSDDESPHSQDFTGLNVCMEDVNSSDDCSSFMCVKRKAEDMEDVFQSNLEGEDLQSLSNFDCLASLSDCKDLNGHDTLEFRDELCLDDDLVDELSSCIDMDSSILDELPSADSLQMSLDCMDDDDQRDEEALLLAEVAKAEAGMSRSAGDYMPDTPLSSGNISDHSDKPSLDRLGKGGKSLAHSKKKMKVDWTAELHRRFVQAVEHLGVDKAIPSRILEIMGVQHLTRHNIASHLQKYRSHKKHMQAREAEAATWNQKRQMEATRQPPQPHVVSRPAPLVPMGLHVWGHPTPDQYWPKPWSSSDGSLWPNPPPVCVDAWGHPAAGAPIFHPSHCLAPFVRIPLAPIPGAINGAVPMHIRAEKLMPGQHPPKDKVDAAINEVMKNPFMPLPLGLKPPSLESVLSELQRQGMKTVPPTTSPP